MNENPCNCEHIDHETGESHPYMAVSVDGPWRAMHVGAICTNCADTHMWEYAFNAEKVGHNPQELYIDVSTGTWGLAEDIVKVFVDPDILEDMSDVQIVEYGYVHGEYR